MSYLDVIQVIKSKLDAINATNWSDQITDSQLSGGTGGEVILMVCSKLIEIQYSDKEVFEFIADEVYDLTNYANSLGLYPKWKGKRLKSS